MRPEALNIVKMISKPLNERMPFEGIQLTKFIQKISFFNRFFQAQAELFVSFCLTAEFIEFKAGQQIYENEQSPSFIYIVLDGKVRLQSLQNGKQRLVEAYDVFGNLEVVFDLEKRGQLACAQTAVSCIVLESKQFKKVWTKSEQIAKTFHYLKTNKYFQNLSDYEKKSLSLLMIHGRFRPGQVLTRQEQNHDRIYFVIYGKLNVMKKLSIKGKMRDAEIDHIQEMDSFGEYEALSNSPSEVSLVAASSGTYYCLVVSEVMKRNHPVLDNLREHSLSYPEKQQLQFRYSVQAEVEKYQSQIEKKMKLPQKRPIA